MSIVPRAKGQRERGRRVGEAQRGNGVSARRDGAGRTDLASQRLRRGSMPGGKRDVRKFKRAVRPVFEKDLKRPHVRSRRLTPLRGKPQGRRRTPLRTDGRAPAKEQECEKE